MRRKHKIHYYVQNWESNRSFWWNRGDWRESVHVPQSGKMHFMVGTEIKGIGAGASSQKHCRNLKAAIKCAKRLRTKGGSPLISQSVVIKGKRYWRDFRLAAN